jgi:hypothetical protein
MGRLVAISIDWRVLGFALLISVLTGVFFGLLPALQPSSGNLNASLREGGRGSKSHGRGLRGALMVSEVALAIVLLAGAGLLIRSFVKLLEVNPGYRAEHLLTARFQLPPRYSQAPGNSTNKSCNDSQLCRVASVGATSHLPLVRYNMVPRCVWKAANRWRENRRRPRPSPRSTLTISAR